MVSDDDGSDHDDDGSGKENYALAFVSISLRLYLCQEASKTSSTEDEDDGRSDPELFSCHRLNTAPTSVCAERINNASSVSAAVYDDSTVNGCSAANRSQGSSAVTASSRARPFTVVGSYYGEHSAANDSAISMAMMAATGGRGITSGFSFGVQAPAE